MTEPRPADDLARVADSQARFEQAIAGLTDDAAAQSSLLPGWSVGHVLSHVARNADSHTRRADAARRGEMIEQYAGGAEGRIADIEAGAARSVVELVVDVRKSAAALWTAWSSLPDEAWDVVSRSVSGHEHRQRELPSRRWQELEVHVVDLGVGPTWRDWSDDFVEQWLPQLRSSLPRRLPPGADVPTLPPREELAWLYGRYVPEGAPELAAWG